MGFTDLGLVNPRDPKVLQRHKVIQRASGAKDILKNAKIYTSLEDAIKDRNIVCGTGMPFDMFQKRSVREYVEPRRFFDKLIDDKSGEEIRLALVFGSEQTGELSSPHIAMRQT